MERMFLLMVSAVVVLLVIAPRLKRASPPIGLGVARPERWRSEGSGEKRAA